MIVHDKHGQGGVDLVGRIPVVMNLTLTLANTEYTLTLPSNTTRFTLQARTAADVKVGTTETQSGTTYLTVKSGSALSEELIDNRPETTNTKLYLQSAAAGTVVEVLCWVSYQS